MLGRRLLRLALVGAAYVPAAWAAGLLTLPPGSVLTFRPPNALLLALALVDAPGRLWLYVLASIPANPTLYARPFVWEAPVGFVLANVIEILIGFLMVRAFLGRAPRFDRVMDCAGFTASIAVACTVSAIVGAATVAVLGGPPFFETWRNWTLADSLSHVVIAPVVMLGTLARPGVRLTRGVEPIAIAVSLVAVTLLATSGRVGHVATYPALVYLPLPFLVWAAIRFTAFESALAVLAVSGAVLGTALTRQGAFAELSTADAALSMQLLLIMIAVPLMFLAATVEERRWSADLLAKAFNASPIGVWITTVADGRVLEINQATQEMLGYSRVEAIGRTTIDLRIWAQPDDRARMLASFREQGRLRDVPIVLRRRDGAMRLILASSEPVEIDGEDAMLGMLRDVTDERRAEEEKARVEAHLQQRQRLEAIGQLAGGIAHDFNNILQAVKGYTELALESLAPNHPAAPQLAQVSDAADRAAVFTAQLLAVSRRDTPRTERLHLNTIVANTSELLRHALGGHVQIAFVEGVNLPACKGDRQQFEHVLMNLCINARDAMEEGGTITIETGRAEFSDEECRTRPWARAGQYVFLRVADEGMGIPDAVRPHIFEPFFTTKTPGSGGGGLGLSTVYAIVERHGGLISVDTTIGKGSVFTVYFPSLKEEAVVAAPARGPVVASGRGETILLAEDEPMVRDLAVDMLQGANYHVLVACDGAEAETIIHDRAAAFQAVVLDVVMPHRNGRQVYETLRSVRPDVPVVFCTGYSFGELSDLEQLAGRAVLAKPYSRASLLGAIRGALDGPRS